MEKEHFVETRSNSFFGVIYMKNHAHKSFIASCNSEQLKSFTQDMMGFRECFSFRVSYRCELFGKQI